MFSCFYYVLILYFYYGIIYFHPVFYYVFYYVFIWFFFHVFNCIFFLLFYWLFHICHFIFISIVYFHFIILCLWAQGPSPLGPFLLSPCIAGPRGTHFITLKLDPSSKPQTSCTPGRQGPIGSHGHGLHSWPSPCCGYGSFPHGHTAPYACPDNALTSFKPCSQQPIWPKQNSGRPSLQHLLPRGLLHVNLTCPSPALAQDNTLSPVRSFILQCVRLS